MIPAIAISKLDHEKRTFSKLVLHSSPSRRSCSRSETSTPVQDHSNPGEM